MIRIAQSTGASVRKTSLNSYQCMERDPPSDAFSFSVSYRRSDSPDSPDSIPMALSSATVVLRSMSGVRPACLV